MEIPRYVPDWPLPKRAYSLQEPGPPAPHDESHHKDETPGRLFLRGADLYNAGFWWEAHEVWEARWIVEPAGATREALQGLIQCCAFLLHHAAGTHTDALAKRAIGHLEAGATAELPVSVGEFAKSFAEFTRQKCAAPILRCRTSP